MDFNFQQHIAHEIYRQQMLQNLPDPYPTMLPVPAPRQIQMPLRYAIPQELLGITVKLQNADLWKEFHQIGTEMIITKSGRRMFPSLRVSLSGLEEDTNYCVFLEMVPTGDCRYKFSGSQWMPAGGAEPQSAQRICLHPDSPALGSHWSAQPVLFNKVKLTNNTLDSSGHIVLTSMHKYQPRLIVVRTSDPNQSSWAPFQSFNFPETEFVAVTAYQNDRITKLKIDNNPFAKGFRENGQSKSKRKSTQSTSPSSLSPASSPTSSSPSSSSPQLQPSINRKPLNDTESTFDQLHQKRHRTNSLNDDCDDCEQSISDRCSPTSSPPSPTSEDIQVIDYNDQARIVQQQGMVLQQFRDRIPHPTWMSFAFSYLYPSFYQLNPPHNFVSMTNTSIVPLLPQTINETNHQRVTMGLSPSSPSSVQNLSIKPRKKCGFSIAAILGCEI